LTKKQICDFLISVIAKYEILSLDCTAQHSKAHTSHYYGLTCLRLDNISRDTINRIPTTNPIAYQSYTNHNHWRPPPQSTNPSHSITTPRNIHLPPILRHNPRTITKCPHQDEPPATPAHTWNVYPTYSSTSSPSHLLSSVSR
jgi:hypothetical protein